MKEYTGRVIAIFTDAHGLFEPTKAALEDMSSRGITEIYSLGDNIGIGPNPSEVMNLLKEYNVISLAGNAEEYINLGFHPFLSYLNAKKRMSHTWTLSKLNEEQIGDIKLMPRSIELLVGGQKIALCHFANDVRIDFMYNSTWTYQKHFNYKDDGSKNLKRGESYNQFNYTNSANQLLEIDYMLEKYGINNPLVRGYLSAKDEPLFAKKRVDFFDAVIQGHVHWKLYDESDTTKFYTIRAVGLAYRKDPIDTASYVILKEHKNGINLEEVLVRFDREKMIYNILSSDIPDQTIKKYTNII